MTARRMSDRDRAERKFTVLFVCTGNTCRSPMAAGAFRARLPADILEWTMVESAGTMGLVSLPASEGAIRAAAANGVDISGHSSKALNAKLIEDADLILVMEPFHREWILGVSPGAGKKTHLLAEFGAKGSTGSMGAGIGDPIGGPLEVFKACFTEISGHLDRCLPAIEVLIRKKTGRTGGRRRHRE